jgi:sensor histidine kinase YesM
MSKIKIIPYKYWAEALFVPPLLMFCVYFLYGDYAFASWRNFAIVCLPWMAAALINPWLCHSYKNLTLRRFPDLKDWYKRIMASIPGYLTIVVGNISLVFWGVAYFNSADYSAELNQSFEGKYVGVVILCVISVLLIAPIQESIVYFEKWRDTLTENERLEKLHLETQFQSLQSQLNPHFLFNSLNVLSSLIAENPRRAEDFVDELSSVYRYLLRSNDRELATVEEELRFIHSFFHLLETRHDAGIALKINVSPEYRAKNLPALALQILLENAVKHNEISPEKPLQIEISTSNQSPNPKTKHPVEHPFLLVRNNIQRKNTRAQSNHVGLANLRLRYELLGIRAFEVQDDGRFFTVALPLV